MKARVKLIEGVSFVGQSASGHSVVMDGAPESGGKNLGVRPMEMLLMGLGGCSAFDVVMILRKSRQQVTDCLADLSAEMDADLVRRIAGAWEILYVHNLTNANVHFLEVIVGNEISHQGSPVTVA